MNERASELLKMTKKSTRAKYAKDCALKAKKAISTKELAASTALKRIFNFADGRLHRRILAEGYLILSYLTSYNHILQSYFILVRHHLLFI